MHFEGSLNDEEAAARIELYEALRAADETDIQRILFDYDAVQDVLEIECDGERPWLGSDYFGMNTSTLRSGSEAVADGEELWADFVLSLKKLVDSEDELGLYA
jgi:hypothetical protein